MRNYIFIFSLLLSCVAMASQDTLALYEGQVRQYADTLDAKSLLKAGEDDSYLLQLLEKQSQELASQRDSLHQLRLQTDTTTAFPFHLGYADSLRIDRDARTKISPLCLPALVKLPKDITLTVAPHQPFAPQATRLDSLQIEPVDVVESARKFLFTHHLPLCKGEYKPEEKEEDSYSIYEMSVATKSLVADVEMDKEELKKILKNRDNPWFKELNLMAQVTQNYVSSNWFEGGNSAFSMYSSVKGQIKYDDKKRITWENYAEWTAGVSTVSGDSLRHVNCSEDLFRLYSKLGVKIIPKLYGSFSAELRTQLFPTFKPNTKDIKTTFMTPFRFNLALGLDYKPVKGLSVVLSPAAFKLVYANDTIRSNYTGFGIEEGKKVLAEVGTSARVEWVWKPLREVALESKLYMYTNYKMVELDLEVACDFIINRFISARVMLHPRYDSSHKTEGEDKAKIQFKELISIGFAHKFH